MLVVANQVFVPAGHPGHLPGRLGRRDLEASRTPTCSTGRCCPDRDQGPSLAALMDRELKGGAKGKTASIGAFDSIYGNEPR